MKYAEAMLAQPFYAGFAVFFYLFMTGQLVPLIVTLGMLLAYVIGMLVRFRHHTVPKVLGVALALGILPPWLTGVAWGLSQLQDPSWILWAVLAMLAEIGWLIMISMVYSARIPKAQTRPLLYTKPEPLIEATCAVCLQRQKTVVMMPCRHLCLCTECSVKVKDQCPMCRAPVQERIAVFV